MKNKDLDELKSFQESMVDKFGFYIHYVMEGDGYNCSIHTHGVWESFHHLDFEFTMGLPAETAAALMHDLVNEVKKGRNFKDGDVYGELVKNYNVKFVKRIETEREVLRVIFPDPKGKFPGEDGFDMTYHQYETGSNVRGTLS